MSNLSDFKSTVLVTVRTETANFQLASTDNGVLIKGSKATALTITVPLEATASIPVGSVVSIEQDGVGQLTVVAEGGVTIRTPETLLSRKQFSTIALTKMATNEWLLIGDLQVV